MIRIRPRLASADVLVGIDDTDNLESRGTGRLARILAQALDEQGLGSPLAATRHQLLVDDRIPYTSHNSSACIALVAGPRADAAAIAAVAGEFLETMSAEGSDPGLAIAEVAVWERPADGDRLSDFGFLAKREVLEQGTARALADELGIHLSPHGGDGGGIIGALAAVALHGSGADGRFLWMPGMRELGGVMTYAELRSAAPIDAALDPGGREPAEADLIELGDWVRPVLREGRAVLLLDPQADDDRPGAPVGVGMAAAAGAHAISWTVSSRDAVKRH